MPHFGSVAEKQAESPVSKLSLILNFNLLLLTMLFPSNYL